MEPPSLPAALRNRMGIINATINDGSLRAAAILQTRRELSHALLTRPAELDEMGVPDARADECRLSHPSRCHATAQAARRRRCSPDCADQTGPRRQTARNRGRSVSGVITRVNACAHGLLAATADADRLAWTTSCPRSRAASLFEGKTSPGAHPAAWSRFMLGQPAGES